MHTPSRRDQVAFSTQGAGTRSVLEQEARVDDAMRRTRSIDFGACAVGRFAANEVDVGA
jgi:hypothetical protein